LGNNGYKLDAAKGILEEALSYLASLNTNATSKRSEKVILAKAGIQRLSEG
jgi:hypothetical protein